MASLGKCFHSLSQYLNNRIQLVVINDTQSSEMPVSFGVPQGSVLGPLLSSLFFVPLEEIIAAHRLNCMIYADDAQLYVSLNPKAAKMIYLQLNSAQRILWPGAPLKASVAMRTNPKLSTSPPVIQSLRKVTRFR